MKKEVPREYLETLINKRCEIYSQIGGSILIMEEAMEKEDRESFLPAFEEMRRIIRISLPFLTDKIIYEMEHLESLVLPAKKTGQPLDFEAIAKSLQLFQIQFSKAIQNPTIQEVEEILSLPKAIREEIQKRDKEFEDMKKKKENREKAGDLAKEAEKLAGERKWKEALKKLEKARELDPEMPFYANDMGVIYAYLGKIEKAEEMYLKALELNRDFPHLRTPEWMHTYYNLAKVQKRKGDELLDRQRGAQPKILEEAIRFYEEAIQNFQKFQNQSGPSKKVEEAQKWIHHLESEIEILKSTLRKIQKKFQENRVKQEKPANIEENTIHDQNSSLEISKKKDSIPSLEKEENPEEKKVENREKGWDSKKSSQEERDVSSNVLEEE
ncbi:MAG: tetratricopeptide repeat protein [Planctomycetota bacterium]|nr:MAG: tetratricopeptide repeat protein [Planctomycetota bacterium]